MKINMLGRDIDVTRQQLLSDGYCLSTVKNAERISAGPDPYVVNEPNADTPGVIWLRGHIPFCKQCRIANEVKNKVVDCLKRHFPSRVVDWHQGRLSKEMMGQVISTLVKTDRKFMLNAISNTNYNLKPIHLQAIEDRDELVRGLGVDSPHFSKFIEPVKKARVTLVDTEILFEAWQLLGSSPRYEKKRLIADFEKMDVKLPFSSVYFAFPEGINRHLIEHFFDNMPAELFGGSSIKGLFLSVDGEQPVMMEHDILSDPALDVEGPDPATVSRNFLWVALMRAIEDKVFTTDLAPESEKERDEYLGSLGGIRPATRAPESFYAVRVSPHSGFRDKARVYGKRHINWTHRWEVAGHWRQYKDGRRIWIGNYVKGPEDKPFIPSVRVYSADGFVARSQNVIVSLAQRLIRWISGL